MLSKGHHIINDGLQMIIEIIVM
jgi:hypothetical protein